MPVTTITRSYNYQPRTRRRSRDRYAIITRIASLETLFPLTFANTEDPIVAQAGAILSFPYTFAFTFSVQDNPIILVDNIDPVVFTRNG